MDASPNRDWLRTPDGRAWLESDEGAAWLRSEEGVSFMYSPEGHAWFEELAQSGFEKFFAGQMPSPPEWAIMPDEAPQIGERVRLAESFTTMGGADFEKGELAIASELKLAPVGCVFVTLRAIDGRSTITGMRGSFLSATG